MRGKKKRLDLAKKCIRRNNFTENFALFDLLKLLTAQTEAQSAPSAPQKESEPPSEITPKPLDYNVMADVIARHESFVNKVKNKK